MAEDESLLICDLAEYYNIYNYRSLSPRMIATLVAGLRDESRLVQKSCGIKASQRNLLLAHIADKLSIVINCLSGQRVDFDSMVDLVSGFESTKASNVMAFDSAEDFQAYWDKINNGG